MNMSLEFRYERQLELLRNNKNITNWEILEYNGYDNVVCKCKICGEIVIKSKSDLTKNSMHKKCRYEELKSKEKNYDFSKLGNEYLKVVSYKNCSNVTCKCLICGEEFITSAYNIRKGRIHKECKDKVFSKPQKRTKKEIEEFLKNYVNENSELIKYESNRKVICRCKICGEEYSTSLYNYSSGKYHKKCSVVEHKNKVKEDRISKFTEICNNIKNEYVEFLKYVNSSEVWCKCKFCGEVYKTTFGSFKKNKVHKPCLKFASDCLRISGEEFNRTVEELYSDIVCTSEYKGILNKVKLRCNACGEEWECIASKVVNIGVRCPNCQKLAGEEAVGNILKNMNIAFEREKEFEGCKNIRNLKFDYYLPEYNMCIEYNGEQHYKDGTLFNDKERSSLECTQKRDNIKREFCKNNGIKLLEIRFNEFRYIKRILKKAILNP